MHGYSLENANSEVYNFALSGSGTDQQYLIWKEYAQNIEADLVSKSAKEKLEKIGGSILIKKKLP